MPNVPFVGGELGPALAVGQGLAAADVRSPVVTIVGDGECETPAALAALAHHRTILDGSDARWLVVVNANGAKMGGRAALDPDFLESIASGMGYEVLRSNDDPLAATAAATLSLDALFSSRRALWISETEKGWPAPSRILGRNFRGHVAHKAGALGDAIRAQNRDLSDWLCELIGEGLFDEQGYPTQEVARIASRVLMTVPTGRRRKVRPEALRSQQRHKGKWGAPISGIDRVLAERSIRVFSPDEASSNGLHNSIERGLVTEVLAEELCAAWTWGSIEANQEAAFVTYEAFAPLAASQIAQYAKLLKGRPRAGRPPFLVILTSLGWANSPTHQNTDFAGTILARADRHIRLVCPVGETSAASRLARELDGTTDSIVTFVCSKQVLPDIDDPSGPALRIRVKGANTPEATIIAIGDICVAEAVEAALAARQMGTSIEVLALVELDDRRLPSEPPIHTAPLVVGGAWCAPLFVSSIVSRSVGRHVDISGYCERWGPSPQETLIANGLDRRSLLMRCGVSTSRLDMQTSTDCRSGLGLPTFDPEQLLVTRAT